MAKAKKQEMTVEERLTAALVPEGEQPYEVPGNWVWTRFDSIKKDETSFFDGDWILSENMDINGDVRLIQLSDIGVGEFLNKSSKYISEDTFCKLNCSELLMGDVLVSRMAEPIARSCIMPNISMKCITAVDIAVMRCNEKIILSKYLNWLCNVSWFTDLANFYARGTTRVRITRKNLGSMPTPLPPLAEQQRIVERIESLFQKLDRAKELVQNALDSFEARKAAILHKAFVGELTTKWREDKGIVIESWHECTLASVMLPMKSKKIQSEYFRYIDIDSINNNIQRVDTPKVLLASNAPSRASREVCEGDTIFSMVRPYLKNIAYIDESLSDCIASTGFYVCKPSVKIVPMFLYRFLTSDEVVTEINSYMKGDNSPSVNKNDIENIKINLPTRSEQQEIVRILDNLFEKEQRANELFNIIKKIDLM